MSRNPSADALVPAVAVASDPRGSALVTVSGDPAEQFELLRSLQDGAVVMIGSAGDSGSYRAFNALARMGAGPRVRVLPCTASPTVLAIAAAVMEYGHFGPGDILEVLRSLPAVTTTVAITGSVARLEVPPPSLAQHIHSVVPSSAFVIDLPGQTVRTGLGALSRLTRMHDAALVLASPGDAQSMAWRKRLAGLAPNAPQFAVDTIAPATVPWRTPVWAEATGVAMTIEQLIDQLRTQLVRQICSSCGASVSGRVCVMCGIVCEPASPLGPNTASGRVQNAVPALGPSTAPVALAGPAIR